MIQEHSVSVRQACSQVDIPRSSFSYRPREKNDQPIIDQLSSITEEHASIGFWMCYYRIRKQGLIWNHKRVYRVYTAMRLNSRSLE